MMTEGDRPMSTLTAQDEFRPVASHLTCSGVCHDGPTTRLGDSGSLCGWAVGGVA
jgi:hypothetical protein